MRLSILLANWELKRIGEGPPAPDLAGPIFPTPMTPNLPFAKHFVNMCLKPKNMLP